jgi:hypothetical protein
MDHQHVVLQSREALQATLTFASRKLGAAAWEPGAGSEAADELANTETRQGGTPWGESPLRTAYAAANLMMIAIRDNLMSLQRLLDDQMPVIGPTVIARSTMEIASGAWWLMQPGIGARSRVCRELALSLTSSRRAQQVARKFQAQGFALPQGVNDALQQEAKVLQRITDLGIARPTAGFSPTVGNEQAQTATDATAAMIKTAVQQVPGDTIYRTYSAVTHGEIYGLMNFMEPGSAPDGSPLLTWNLPPALLDSTIEMAILAFRESYRRINNVMGWGKLEGELWEIKLEKIYNT